ncbi:MAG: hypothetical protein J2P50_20605, partial [Hyphomicrobiaceae bacterium]|nr:hypothetical protein [Hyphomicrobiaceae bacterium]
EGATDVGKAYLLEHGPVIRTDAINMARDLDDAAPEVGSDGRKFRELVMGQAGLRDLPAAYVIDRLGNVKLAVLEEQRIPYVPPPEELIHAADQGQVPLLMPTKSEGLDGANIPYQQLPAYLERDAQRARVAALVKLNNYPGSYLYVARGIDP